MVTMRMPLLAVLLLTPIAAAPSTRSADAITSWREVVAIIPKDALPTDGAWKERELADARKALDAGMNEAHVRLSGVIAWQKVGLTYLVRTERQSTSGIGCYCQFEIADEQALRNIREGERLTLVGTVATCRIGNLKPATARTATTPFLKLTLHDVHFAPRKP